MADRLSWMNMRSPYRLVTTRCGTPGLPFGWEIHDEAGTEISRSPGTFRSRHEAATDGEQAIRRLVELELNAASKGR
jgi:hypothetical protein